MGDLGKAPRPASRALAALALVTACTLAFQVVFTRMMSSVLAYHFSFMAVSLVLLGTGAGSLLVYLRPEWFAEDAAIGVAESETFVDRVRSLLYVEDRHERFRQEYQRTLQAEPEVVMAHAEVARHLTAM